MSYAVVTTPDADADLFDACSWYAEQSEDLDLDFLDDLREVTEQIALLPNSFPTVYKSIRLALMRRFPYKVFFIVEEPERQAVLLAVIHHARHPQKWKKRV